MTDHHYYSGPANSRRIPLTDIRSKNTAGEPVASLKDEGTGSSIASNQVPPPAAVARRCIAIAPCMRARRCCTSMAAAISWAPPR